MKRLPTDLAILNAIYDRYYADFVAHSREAPTRSSKVYVPIDVKIVASDFNVDPDIVFGRLYYHLNEKHGYSHNDGTKVAFFTLKAGQDRHCVNFPYLASILADIREEHRKYRIATGLAVLSFGVSLVSLYLSLFP